ncbi:MAG: riboflavin synthase [Polyangiaceae bacterium]|nr:riboflavin synthase [Polyangiaceae bacterium]
MFTGLVEAVGRVRSLVRRGAEARLAVAAPFGPFVLGESVAVSGACLTVTALVPDGSAAGGAGFEADVSGETLDRTTLGALAPGDAVNLERALRLGDRMGGHLVLGHVDGVGAIVAVEAAGGTRRVRVRAPGELARYLAPKGSVALDGVSLTLNAVEPAQRGAGHCDFELMLVPHTLGMTTLTRLAVGQRCNLEIDVNARYVARVLEHAGIVPGEAGASAGPGDAPEERDARLREKLASGGFV